MGRNKIVYAGETLIDLTADTVTAETLAEGVTAHGADGEKIVGTMKGGGPADDVATAIVTRTITEYSNTEIARIGNYALSYCSNLVRVNTPNVTAIASLAFAECAALEYFAKPTAVTGCSLGGYAFQNCTSLKRLDIIGKGTIGAGTFSGCSSLNAFILRNPYSNDVVALANRNVFTGTPIASGNGYVYVALDFVEAYRTKTNWVSYASQIMPTVSSVAKLDGVDGTVYARAWVDDVYKPYVYNGSAWVEVNE